MCTIRKRISKAFDNVARDFTNQSGLNFFFVAISFAFYFTKQTIIINNEKLDKKTAKKETNK
jgi:Fe-S cluster biosynthesis and repair protein YggX